MINLLLGAPGGGKSYEAVAYHVIPTLKAGRRVITNLPLNAELIFAAFPDVTPDLLHIRKPEINHGVAIEPFSRLEHWLDDWRDSRTGQGALFIVDECHRALPRESRTRAGTPREIELFFAEHRHAGADILLITQAPRSVSLEILDRVELTYRVIKARFLGRNNSYIRKVIQGIKGGAVDEQEREYNPAYFPFYKSHTASNKAVLEAGLRDVRPRHLIFRKWAFMIIGVGVVFLIFSLSRLSDKREAVSAGAPQARPVSPQMPPAPVLPASTTPVQLSSSPADTMAASVPPVTAPASSPEKPPEKPPEKIHPLTGKGLHIAAFIRGNDTLREVYYFMLSQNGQGLTMVTSDQLTVAGYEVVGLGPCFARLSFPGVESFYSACDAPRVDVLPAMSHL